MNQELKKELAVDIHGIGALKFGEFTYKSGLKGPMYLDLRLLISYPEIMKKVAKLYAKMLSDIQYDRLMSLGYSCVKKA
jgi:orotate phosphoribosyltransferase